MELSDDPDRLDLPRCCDARYASYGFTPLPDGRFLKLRGDALSRRAG